jgi:hypothetical protein
LQIGFVRLRLAEIVVQAVDAERRGWLRGRRGSGDRGARHRCAKAHEQSAKEASPRDQAGGGFVLVHRLVRAVRRDGDKG